MHPHGVDRKCIKPGDLIVISYPEAATSEHLNEAREKIAIEFPGSRVVVLDRNATIEILDHRKALERIESKLDALLAALAEEEEGEPSMTLDGEYAGSERDQSQGL